MLGVFHVRLAIVGKSALQSSQAPKNGWLTLVPLPFPSLPFSSLQNFPSLLAFDCRS